MFSFRELSIKEKNDILQQISNNYNSNLDFLTSKFFYINENSNKIYLSNISYSDTNLDLKRINNIGLYFGTIHDKNRFRLSIEGTQLIEVNQNYIVLNEKNIKSYISGENLFKDEVKEINIKGKAPFLIVKYNNDNIGCVNIKDDMILNYIPKYRRLNFDKLF
ncbi:MAG: NIP7 pre-PUA domain-containing protein [Nanoarchaeota archaeon]